MPLDPVTTHDKRPASPIRKAGRSRAGFAGNACSCGVNAFREEKNSVAIASNRSFSGWTDTFTDIRLGAAIVDRLTYRGTIIEAGTRSYRLAHTQSATD